MGAQLRVVLDPGAGKDAVEGEIAPILVEALIAAAPTGCAVAVIAPAGVDADIPRVRETRVLRRSRERLAHAWRRGRSAGAGAGLIHAPTLLAPLARRGRAEDGDQVAVTLWDLRAWDADPVGDRAEIAWQRAMLTRAVRFADAVVVPSHAMAARLGEIAPLGGRIRVIAGAPTRRLPMLPGAAKARPQSDYVVLTGGDERSLAAGRAAAEACGVRAVVLGAESPGERAAILAGAGALVATEPGAVWPWRAVDAMALGVPVVAAASAVHRDVIADGGLLVDPGELAEALEATLGPAAERMRVLARDRSRAFSWASTAERVWALHADL